jgi:Putative threonine efflux protein
VPSLSTYAVFVATCLALLAIPGPAVLYIVSRSIDQGRAAGLLSVLGVTTGTLVHIAAAAIGLSSLVLASTVAFSAVRYAGAVYLVFLGVRGCSRAIRKRSSRRAHLGARAGSTRRVSS